MKKKIIIILILCGAIAAATGLYLFNKPRESVADMKTELRSEAALLVADFESDEQKANEKYLGKVIEVTGVVSVSNINEQGELNVTLMGGDLAGVGCQFENTKKAVNKKINIGDTVTIKGICTGILIDVVLVDCVIAG